jgi:hypothetical protein
MVPPMRTQAEADSQAAQAYKQMQSQQGAQQQAPQMPVQGPMPPNANLMQLFKMLNSPVGLQGLQQAQQQAPQQNFIMYEGLNPEAAWRNAPLPSLGGGPPQQGMPQAGTMPFPAGDPRYVNTLPYMGPPVTGPALDMSKQLGPQMTQPLPSTMTTTYPPQQGNPNSPYENQLPLGQNPYQKQIPKVGLGQAPNKPQKFGQRGGGIGQLYGQLGVNNGAQLFGQSSSAPGRAPNSAPGAAPTSGPVAAPTGPASVNMF